MDLATLLGIGAAAGLVAAAMVLGGSAAAFVDAPSVLIVVGGTLGVVTASFTFGEVLRVPRLILGIMFHRLADPSKAARGVIELSVKARKEGVLALQNVLGDLDAQPCLQRGLSLVVDGTPGDDVEDIMRREASAIIARQAKSVNILRRAAEVSPAMGLIGTLIGLVQMLGRLDDPSSIGPSMAVALLTTFYGVLLATLVFSPLAAKLERNSAEEALLNNVYVTATSSIGRQENPRRLEMLLNTILPPTKRIQVFG